MGSGLRLLWLSRWRTLLPFRGDPLTAREACRKAYPHLDDSESRIRPASTDPYRSGQYQKRHIK